MSDVYFWATHGGAELDLFFMHGGRRFGVEIKFTDAPAVTKSMRIALRDLQLDRLWIVAPVETSYELAEKIEVCPPGQWRLPTV